MVSEKNENDNNNNKTICDTGGGSTPLPGMSSSMDTGHQTDTEGGGYSSTGSAEHRTSPGANTRPLPLHTTDNIRGQNTRLVGSERVLSHALSMAVRFIICGQRVFLILFQLLVNKWIIFSRVRKGCQSDRSSNLNPLSPINTALSYVIFLIRKS